MIIFSFSEFLNVQWTIHWIWQFSEFSDIQQILCFMGKHYQIFWWYWSSEQYWEKKMYFLNANFVGTDIYSELCSFSYARRQETGFFVQRKRERDFTYVQIEFETTLILYHNFFRVGSSFYQISSRLNFRKESVFHISKNK